MKLVTYKCELCRTTVDPADARGVYWTADTTIRLVPAREAETHLCANCLHAIRNADSQPTTQKD